MIEEIFNGLSNKNLWDGLVWVRDKFIKHLDLKIRKCERDREEIKYSNTCSNKIISSYMKGKGKRRHKGLVCHVCQVFLDVVY